MATYDPFDWASSATGFDTPSRPVDAEIANGWTPGRVVTSAVLNWAFALLGRLASVAAKYDTLEDAVVGLSAGQIAWVFEEADGSLQAGTIRNALSQNFDYNDVDVSGRYLYTLNGPNGGLRVARTATDTVGSTLYNISNPGTPTRIRADGTSVVIAYGNWVECFDNDGTVRWEYDHGAAVNDIAIDGGQVYMVGAAGGGVEVVAIDINSSGTPSAAWTYAHGATLQSVAVGGGRVVIAGAAGSGGPTMRALDASDGSALWSRTPVAMTANRCLATDGRIILAGFPTGSGHEVAVYGLGDGELRASRALYDLSGSRVSARCVTLDQHYLYAGFTDGSTSAEEGAVRAFTPDLLAEAWEAHQESSGGDPLGVVGIASDGQALFAASWYTGHSGTPNNTIRVRKGRGPMQVLAVNVANDYLPARQTVLPVGW